MNGGKFTKEELEQLFHPPNVEKLITELVELDKAISGARDYEERVRLLSASYLKDKRESIHLQVALYRHYEREEDMHNKINDSIVELNKTIEGLKDSIKPVLEKQRKSTTIQGFLRETGKTILLVGGSLTAAGAILAAIAALLRLF